MILHINGLQLHPMLSEMTVKALFTAKVQVNLTIIKELNSESATYWYQILTSSVICKNLSSSTHILNKVLFEMNICLNYDSHS